MKKSACFTALKIGIVLGIIISATAFILSALRANLYVRLIPHWVIYLFATVTCFIWAFSITYRGDQKVNFLDALIILGVVSITAAMVNGLEAYYFTAHYDQTFLTESMETAQANWKKYNYSEEAIATQWEQTLFKDPVNYGWETTKNTFFFNNVLGGFAFITYFIWWLLKKPKKRRIQKV